MAKIKETAQETGARVSRKWKQVLTRKLVKVLPDLTGGARIKMPGIAELERANKDGRKITVCPQNTHIRGGWRHFILPQKNTKRALTQRKREHLVNLLSRRLDPKQPKKKAVCTSVKNIDWNGFDF